MNWQQPSDEQLARWASALIRGGPDHAGCSDDDAQAARVLARAIERADHRAATDDDEVSPTEVTVEAFGDRAVEPPRWIIPALVTAAAALVAAFVGLDVGPRDRVQTLADTARATAWRLAGDPDHALAPSLPGSSLSVGGIATTTSGYLAVGTQRTAAEESAAIWWSTDGDRWAREPDDLLSSTRSSGSWTDSTATDVAADGQRLVVVGSTASTTRPLAWTRRVSDLQWERYDLPSPGHSSTVTAVAATPRGFIAVGTADEDTDGDMTTGARPVIWTSADGASWRVQELPTAAGENGAVSDIAYSEPRGYFVVGSIDQHPAVWDSRDGIEWDPLRISEFDPAHLTGVAVTPEGRVLAVGRRPAAQTDASFKGVAVWLSSEPDNWTAASLGLVDASTDRIAGPVVAGEFGFLVLAHDVDDADGRSVALWSSDGASWTTSLIDLPGFPTAAVSGEGRIVTVGPSRAPIGPVESGANRDAAGIRVWLSNPETPQAGNDQ